MTGVLGEGRCPGLDARRRGWLFLLFSRLSLDCTALGGSSSQSVACGCVPLHVSLKTDYFPSIFCLFLVEFEGVEKSKNSVTPASLTKNLLQNDFSPFDIFTWMCPRYIEINMLKSENIFLLHSTTLLFLLEVFLPWGEAASCPVPWF